MRTGVFFDAASRHSPRSNALVAMLALAALVACRPNTLAMSSSTCPSHPLEDAKFGRRYLPCQLKKLPVLLVDTTIAHYPGMLRPVGLSGRVRVAFVVDTAGRYLPGSIRALSSSHDVFLSSAKFLLQRSRFS